MTTYRKAFLIVLLLVFAATALFGAKALTDDAYGHSSQDMLHTMSMLVLQLGFILFAGYAGAVAAAKMGIPTIIGELIVGILIGPHLLGSFGIPLFPHGLFPLADNPLGISAELYGFATVASVVLLFLTGLQTDLRLFLRFAFKGSIVGLTGAALSLSAGIITGFLFLNNSLFDPRNIFLGTVAIATSIDISARILSERRKMTSPEGVTILAASVLEDVIGITVLALVVGVETATQGVSETWRNVVIIGGRALLLWLGFTVLGIAFSQHISALLKKVRNQSQIAVLALGISLLISGLFETAGLAMIIGAYIAGLSLANTDISFVIQEKIETIHHFFDPIFFVVIGMIVNVHVLFSPDVLVFGLAFGILAWLSKLIGCGVPALFAGFTKHGALRISLGMVPRGEVALIIAAIGIGTGIIDEKLFGIIIFMTLLTTLTAPPLFSLSLVKKRRTTVKDIQSDNTETTSFQLGSTELKSFLLDDILLTMRSEGFFVHSIDAERKLYEMRKDLVFLSLEAGKESLHFTGRSDDVTFINNLIYESILTLQQKVNHIKTMAKPIELQKNLIAKKNRALVDWYKYLSIDCINLSITVKDKKDAIMELINLLLQAGKISDIDEVKQKVFDREATMSTGMQNGIAIPHGRSTSIKELSVAVGVSQDGLEFNSIDNKPAQFIFLVVSPQDNSGPHLQILAGIAGILNSEEARQEILKMKSRKQLIDYMVEKSNKK